jgi:catechol 2,3-dioxygenase
MRGCNNNDLVGKAFADDMMEQQEWRCPVSDKLPASTALGAVTLRVADLDRSLAFYQDLLGFEVLAQGKDGARLGAAGRLLLVLQAHPGLPPRLSNAPGLFHVAILLPDRPALGAMLARLVKRDVRLGASDHIVSEALYLDDPDGNGLEIYRDRSREEWHWVGNEVEMATEPMDAQGVLAQAATAEEPYQLPTGTTIGHVHLQVGDLEEARRFYSDALGFDVTTESYSGALFVSAGGYHHHLGLNVWRSRGGRMAPRDRAGMEEMTIKLPAADIPALRERLAGAAIETRDAPDGFHVRDPWDNDIRIAAA